MSESKVNLMSSNSSPGSLLIEVLDLYQNIATDSGRVLMIAHETIGKGDDTLLKLTINEYIDLNKKRLIKINSLLTQMEIFASAPNGVH